MFKKKWILLFSGLILILSSWMISQVYNLKSQNTKPTISRDHPKRIVISSLKIDAPINYGGLIKNKWIISSDAVLYLPTSGALGEGYNTILYAHNKKGLFADLPKIKVGSTIEVYDNEGKKFIFEVYQSKYVTPRNLDALKINLPNSLTLFTCTGLFDSQRFVAYARLISPNF